MASQDPVVAEGSTSTHNKTNETQENEETNKKFIEASALLSHVEMLESKLPAMHDHMGHAPPPQLYMCRIPDPDRPGKDLNFVAIMAVTKRCISAQLLKESKSYTSVGPPVEVLVMNNNYTSGREQQGDSITCATMFALERLELTAADAVIVPDRSKKNTKNSKHNRGSTRHRNDNDDDDEDAPGVPPTEGISLMSGGLVPVAPSPRVAVVVGTLSSRVIAIEFSVRPQDVQLVRRNFIAASGMDTRTYFEPLPSDRLTPSQEDQKGRPKVIKKQQQQTFNSSEYHNGNSNPNMMSGNIVPFDPSGGVVSLTPYSFWQHGNIVTYVWISYGDGTAVRLHHAGFFPSVIQKHQELPTPRPTLEHVLDEHLATIKWQAKLPPLQDTLVHLIPIPKYHPSPLAPFPTWSKQDYKDENNGGDHHHDDFAYIFEAVSYASGAMADTFPTLAFYTSEDQFDGRLQGDLLEDDLLDMQASSSSGAGNLVTSMISGLFGMVSGASSSKSDKQKDDNNQAIPWTNDDEWDPEVPFPSINYEPFELYAGCEIHDPPREVVHCTVDPEGDLAAISDTLGRVSLVDLATKQIIRMWKGFRDTSCYWLQKPKQNLRGTPWQKSKTLYLVIHSRQRKVLEIWRTRHGPRVKTMQVGREAQVISCRELARGVGYIATCYLAHSNVPFSQKNKIERIVVEEDESQGTTQASRNRMLTRPDLAQVSQDAAAKLNRLQQLLAPETNVECESVDVFKALEKISSVEDLATALDLLATTPTLEHKMGIEGSTFQKLATSHCTEKLNEAIRDGGEDVWTNEHVLRLAFKIAFYSQVSTAYDVLHGYETRTDETTGSFNLGVPTHWGHEAIGWTSTYEKIMKRSIDDEITCLPTEPMKFCEFAIAVEEPKKWMEDDVDFTVEGGGYNIHFSDSTKTRKDILMRVFQPLLGDVFSYQIVNQILDALGFKNDYDYVLKCFGEWFTSLSVKDATKRVILPHDSPTSRWLQEIITAQLAKTTENETHPLESLKDFCKEAEELPRAFWLAVLCRDVVDRVAASEEEKTYGKVSREDIVGEWDTILRQLRVCLLVSLRLNGMQLGACPISIAAVEKGDNFSVYDWLAKDELTMSHNHDEIVSLENACRISSHAFDPSTPEGDEPSRTKILNKACLSAPFSEAERSEYMLDFDDDDGLGSLLLFFKHHNRPEFLVAHRALQLSAKWGREPKDLGLLDDAITALKAVDPAEHKRIASALRLEIWQGHIRPVYRALLMGFDDVQEISPEVVGPLLQDFQWVKHFSAIATHVLDLLNQFEWHESESVELYDHEIHEVVETWPPLVDCFMLKRLVERNRKIRESAFEAHKVLMSALKVSRDIGTLSRCVPSFYDLFTPGALFNPVDSDEEMEENQHKFMQDAVVGFARHYNGPVMDDLKLGDIEVICELWEFEMENVKTLFLLSMYEYGKDRIVDEQVMKSAATLCIPHFCEDGVEIICRRLNKLLHVDPSDKIRNIMGSLDAAMCEWIKGKAARSEPLVEDANLDVPPGHTHLFALRLLSLAASADIPKEERIKIHSLIVLSGSIVKALEEDEETSISMNEEG